MRVGRVGRVKRLIKERKGHVEVRKHLTYTNAMVTVAVVFAMSGGAYAANKYVINTTKQINPKVLANLKGKAGANGAQGPAGAAGPQGPAAAAGPKGEAGPSGQNGAPGEKGAQGEKGAPGSNGFNGAKGGTGAPGPAGPAGSPWTAGGTLPVGSEEKGQWSFAFRQATESSQTVSASISFPIPLASAISEAHTHFIGPEEGEGEADAKNVEGCSGNYKDPKAASGNLCVFTRRAVAESVAEGIRRLETSSFNVYDAETGEPRAGRSGAYMLSNTLGHWVPGEGEGSSKIGDIVEGEGDWVVTG